MRNQKKNHASSLYICWHFILLLCMFLELSTLNVITVLYINIYSAVSTILFVFIYDNWQCIYWIKFKIFNGNSLLSVAVNLRFQLVFHCFITFFSINCLHQHWSFRRTLFVRLISHTEMIEKRLERFSFREKMSNQPLPGIQ
jgi:hypothetical protein